MLTFPPSSVFVYVEDKEIACPGYNYGSKYTTDVSLEYVQVSSKTLDTAVSRVSLAQARYQDHSVGVKHVGQVSFTVKDRWHFTQAL